MIATKTQAGTFSKEGRIAQKLQLLEFRGWLVVFLTAASLIAIERFTPVYLNNFYVRLLLYCVASSLLVLWLSWILFGFKAVKWRWLIVAGVILICVAKALASWGGDWKTQTILFQSKEHGRTAVEFQMRADWFAFGYKERVVKRQRLLPFVDYISDVDTLKLDPAKWTRVNQNVNQMGLSGFSGPAK